jgi:hypothetical protein
VLTVVVVTNPVLDSNSNGILMSSRLMMTGRLPDADPVGHNIPRSFQPRRLTVVVVGGLWRSLPYSGTTRRTDANDNPTSHSMTIQLFY